jgi:hypothetical protein
MTEQPRPKRQSRLTLFALAHPFRLAITSGLVIAAWAAVIVGDWRAVVGAGAGVFMLQCWIWGPRGLGRRREERLLNSDSATPSNPGEPGP